MPISGFCMECNAPTPTLRCPPCQRRHNLRLQAEHDQLVRSMFKSLDRRGGSSADELDDTATATNAT